MKLRKIAAVLLLVASSFTAKSAAPSKTELETMYDKAFREFDANDYEQALKDLDAIDAREPDLVESQNLRGVILMRQKDYANAEKALQKALAGDPKFWNARFNLAEIPFLEKNWPEARKRFQELLNGNASELQGEATQLIQYKALITYLMEGKEDMVRAMVAKFELAPDTPALQYANAAIALQKKDEKGARDTLATAEKNFSPQLNKLFAESLYEVGWLEKPAGESRAALELNSAAERVSKTKAFAQARFDEAEQALQQRDFTAARKLVDEADTADPNQASTINLRGEILLEQREFDAAESEFKKAAKLDPKARDAQYNLAQIPFKKKEYAKARDRFEALFSTTSGTDKDSAAQLIKYKVYLTYLLEGKDTRAQKLMEQFQFTGDTPALYYAQAAWEFKHSNSAKANEWVTSARKIYSPALNGVFADAFFDLGWIQSAAAADAGAPAIADATTSLEQALIEPTPIPATAIAKEENANPAAPLTSLAQTPDLVAGMEATASAASQLPAASSAIGASVSPSVETPVASTSSPAAARPIVADASEKPASSREGSAPAKAKPAPASVPNTTAAASASPATVLAPAQVGDRAQPAASEKRGRNTLLVVGLLMAAILLIAWVMIPGLRRRMAKAFPSMGFSESAALVNEVETVGGIRGELVAPTRLAGGPPQVSLQLRASEPALRRAVMPLGRNGRAPSNGAGQSTGSVAPAVESFSHAEPVAPPPPDVFEEGVGEAVSDRTEEGASSWQAPVADRPYYSTAGSEEFEGEPALVSAPLEVEPVAESATTGEATSSDETLPVVDEALQATEATAPAPESADTFVAPADEIPTEPLFVTPAEFFGPAATFTASEPAAPPMAEPSFSETAEPAEELLEAAFARMSSKIEPSFREEWGEDEPIGQGQPIPYLEPATPDDTAAAEFIELESDSTPEPVTTAPAVAAAGVLAGIGTLRQFVESLSSSPQVGSSEQTAEQPTIPATMPEPTQPTPSPVIRTSPNGPPGSTPQPQGGMQPAAPSQSQPGGSMHTAVQLTFSFEIASLQLTPSFKMGALQLKPTSKIVTMRLAPSQHPQPAMNLQVTFEIATVQLNGNSLGMIRLTPSQQQRPGILNSPTFNIAALQLVSGSESAPVQITPSQQGQASVHVTAPFQIATVEFSPSFEIASIVLNATSNNVSVQLPGAGPSAVEGAPVFEVSNVQLSGNGEIGMIQLNPQGAGPKQIA